MSQENLFRIDSAPSAIPSFFVDTHVLTRNRTRDTLATTALVTLLLGLIGCGASDTVQTQSDAPDTTNFEHPTNSINETDSTGPANEVDDVLAVGDKAPDFEIEALGGESLRLSSHCVASKGPIILLFDRAHW